MDVSKGNSFQEFFEQFGGLVLFSLAARSNYSMANYVKIPVFHFFFEEVNKGQLNVVSVNY